MSEFTDKQISDWRAYECLRKSGVINMFDVRTGGALTGLSPDEYMFCLKNYSEMKDQADKDGDKSARAL